MEKLIIIIVAYIIMIYFIKSKLIKSFLIKLKKKKYYNKIVFIIKICIIIISIIFVIYQIISILKDISSKKEFDRENSKYDQLISEEIDFYSNAIKKEYKNQKPEEPYIPENFEYVEGTWNTGFVIQDENKNQYVWVPCTNKDNTEFVKLEKRNNSSDPLISKDLCADLEYKDFVNSALENGGFYISRFEIGKENEKPVSKANSEVWSNVTINQSLEIVSNMYKQEGINCKLINGYAYDTTLEWINSTNVADIDIIDATNEKIYTGRKKYNNIYDFMDNVMEITMENSYGTVIIRGFPYIVNKDTKMIVEEMGLEMYEFDRLSILESDSSFSGNTILSFRTVLYK